MAVAAAACVSATAARPGAELVDSATLLEAARESVTENANNLAARRRNEITGPSLDPMLRAMARQAQRPAAARMTAPAGIAQYGAPIRNGRVLVEALPRGDGAALARQLIAAGAVGVSNHGSLVTGWVPVETAESLTAVTAAASIRASLGTSSNAGTALTQGDAAQRSNTTRLAFRADGAGTGVGIISDSFNALNGESLGIATGNLPGPGNPNGFTMPVKVLKDLSSFGFSDEGRAMAEIIHDIVPAARLSFYSPDSYLDLAVGVRALANAGATVVVDDLTFFGEPWFQQSPAGTVATELSNSNRAVVVSSAGNASRDSIADPFRPSTSKPVLFNGASIGNYRLHRFQNGQVTVPIRLRGGATPLTFILQWDDPFKSAAPQSSGGVSDLDLLVFSDPEGVNVVAGSLNDNVGGDALEGIFVGNNSTNPEDAGTVYLGIGLSEGSPVPRNLKVIAFRVSDTNDIGGRSVFNKSTIAGHANDLDVISTCAVRYDLVGNGSTAVVQAFSSQGGHLQTLGANGNRLSAPRNTLKPDVCSPDGVNTSFFAPFGPNDFDSDGLPNFFGTSAAAPHLAGIVAQMQQVSRYRITPRTVKRLLLQTAVDMDNPITPGFDVGYDPKTGNGFLFAPSAVGRALVGF